MDWNSVVEGIKTFFNQPIPIIGCTIGFALVFVLTVISKTSIGRKTLKKLGGWYDELKTKYNEFHDDVSKNVAEMQKTYNEQIAVATAKWNEANELIELLVENSHNVKVKDAYQQYKEKINGYATNFENTLQEKINEKVEKIENLEIGALKTQINDLLAELEKVSKNAENEYENIKSQLSNPDTFIELIENKVKEEVKEQINVAPLEVAASEVEQVIDEVKGVVENGEGKEAENTITTQETI